MAVKELGVSYYGVSRIEHARADFEDIRAHNCNAVLLALTEFDLFFWRPQIPKLVEEAKRQGLTVYLNTWGIGKFFGGEAPSIFLQECSVEDRQFSALTDQPLAAASPSSPAFREYVWELVDYLARTCDADGFFWDEPHYAMPIDPVGYQSTTDFTCRSKITQAKFRDRYGYDMPRTLSAQVRKFRHDEANDLLIECSRIAKSRNPGLTVTQCSLPADNNYYLSQQRGFDDWESIAARPDIDTFATSIFVDPEMPLAAHSQIARKTVDLARANGKRPQRWIMSYFASPSDLSQLTRIAQSYDEAGVESIFTWTYRAGEGTFLAAPDPAAAWQAIGDAFGAVAS